MINIMKLRPSLLPLVVTSHKETLDLAGADQQLVCHLLDIIVVIIILLLALWFYMAANTSMI